MIVKDCGLVTRLEEKYIDAASTISGCAPAYTYLYADALISAVENIGIENELATKLAGEMLIGAGKTILETGKKPSTLIDEVCSPGGCTIEGIKVMQDNNIKDIMMQATSASYEKNKKL